MSRLIIWFERDWNCRCFIIWLHFPRIKLFSVLTTLDYGWDDGSWDFERPRPLLRVNQRVVKVTVSNMPVLQPLFIGGGLWKLVALCVDYIKWISGMWNTQLTCSSRLAFLLNVPIMVERKTKFDNRSNIKEWTILYFQWAFISRCSFIYLPDKMWRNGTSLFY